MSSSCLPPPAAKGAADPTRADLAHQAVGILGRLATVFGERRKQLAESVGLTDQQWQALEEVQSEHFMPSLFAQKRETSAAAVSKILKQLSAKGLVVVSLSEMDGRQRSYQVTTAGWQVLEALRAERERVIAELWMAQSPTDLENFVAFGEKISAALETLAERHRHGARAPASLQASPSNSPDATASRSTLSTEH